MTNKPCLCTHTKKQHTWTLRKPWREFRRKRPMAVIGCRACGCLAYHTWHGSIDLNNGPEPAPQEKEGVIKCR